jgi:hypothetical protein
VQVKEENVARSAHCAGANNDGEPEAPKTLYMRSKLTKNEKGLQEDTRESRSFNYVRLAGGVNNVHRLPSAEELVNVQGSAGRSRTSAVPVSLSDVNSTPRRELEHRNGDWTDRPRRSCRYSSKCYQRVGRAPGPH